MKKVLVIALATITAVVILCSAASAVISSGNTSNGVIYFESTNSPALNFSLPVSRAEEIYQLLPESVTTVCEQEYTLVRNKCSRTKSFTHEGVSIKYTGVDPSMSFVFSIPGYKLTVNEVSWNTIDKMFNTSAGK